MSMDVEAREHWGRAAEAWARHAELIDEEGEPVTEWMLAAAAPAPGESVVELGAGPGGVGLSVAPAIAPGGRVVVTDVAEAMLAVARQRARALGLKNVEFQVADAMELGLPDACADVVLCRFAYMAMPDPARALAETRRILRPEGRVALAVWGPPERNPWASLADQALRERSGRPPPGPGEPGMFALADEGRLRRLLDAAGFTGPRLERVRGVKGYASFETWWQLRRELAAGVRETMSSMSPGECAKVERELRDQARRFARDGGLEFPWEALAAFARRPPT